ncbi:MAG: hypothetical protein KUG78_09895 [Kangiellaceae bacterium]|nr:hypothetical protein [Kangiellaceae bacterium]
MKCSFLSAILLCTLFTSSSIQYSTAVPLDSKTFDTNSLTTDRISLLPSEQAEFRRPSEPLKLTFPYERFTDQEESIIIELDAIDITSVIQQNGDEATFTPPQALSVGSHELRVVEYTEEGDIEELAFWVFEIRQSKLFEQYQLSVDTQLASNYQLSEKNAASTKAYQGQAVSQVAFNARNGSWQTEGQFDLFYDSIEQNRPTERSIENSDFLFSVGNDYHTAKIGHHSPAVTSLVMDNFRRRGLSLESKLASISSRVSGFVLSSLDVSGLGNGLAISNATQRVSGMTIDSSPFTEAPRSLYLTATWLSAKTSKPNQFSINSNNSPYTGTDGDAWALSGESLLFDSKLRLKAEYAETDYDFDVNDNIESDSDKAYHFLLAYNDVTDFGVVWNAGASTQKIGTFFKSSANQGLPSDKKATKTFAGAQWQTFGVQANVERQEDNVNNLSQLPRIQTDLASFNFNWSPTIEDTGSVFGLPSLVISTTHQSQLQTSRPISFTLPEANSDVQNWQLGSQFSFQQNSWGLSLNATELVDRSFIQPHSKTYSIDWHANLFFGEDSNTTLTPFVAWNETTDKINQTKTRTMTYALQAAFTIVPNKLNFAFNLNWNKNRINQHLLHDDNLAANASLSWYIIQPSENEFGVDLSLSGTYNDYEDQLFVLNSIKQYQTFLTLSVILPTRAGQEQ